MTAADSSAWIEPLVEALRAHPPTYTEHATDPQTLYCPPCSERIGEWVTWTPEHVATAVAEELQRELRDREERVRALIEGREA